MGLQRFGLVLAGLLMIGLIDGAGLVSAATITIDTSYAGGIEKAAYLAGDGGTVILQPGTYNQHDIHINKSVRIQADTANNGDAGNTIIDAQSAGSIFSTENGISVAFDNLTMKNGVTDVYGAAITAFMTDVTITSCSFVNCAASYGGAIFIGGNSAADAGDLTITSSSFTDCSADNWGGAIEAEYGHTTITSSTFTGCTATLVGGAVDGYEETLTITSCSFKDCTSSGHGGAVNAQGGSGATIRFSRISGSGNQVYNDASTVNAANNWWGTNAGPSGFTSGATDTPWLKLGITATPLSITTSQTSQIRANMTFDSTGSNTSGGGFFVPDIVPVGFEVSSGSGDVAPTEGMTTSGVNATLFTPAGAGAVTLSATVDNQPVSIPVTVTRAPLPVAGFTADPVSGDAPLEVTFTDDSDVVDGTLRNWSFGDGAWENTTSSTGPVHTYTAGGTYDVALTVTNSSGSNITTKSGFIAVNALPVAGFTADPVSGDVPLEVTFTDDSDVVDGTLWNWSFGDDTWENTTSSTGPVHTYSSAGTYDVSLTVTNSSGSDTDTKTGYITAAIHNPVRTLNPGNSIQQNVTGAAAGDTIILNPGIYHEHDIIVERNLTIRANASAGGDAANTIIDAEYAGRIFNGDADIVFSVDNLTLKNGLVSDNGGAINAAHARALIATSSVFSNCSAGEVGGAIYIMWRQVTINASTFSNCSAQSGGAVGSYHAGDGVIVTSSTFDNCSATISGGAIDAGISNVSSSVFRNCSAGYDGGMINMENGTVTTSVISGCSAGQNGGALFMDTGAVTVDSSSFDNCSAVLNGGAIYSMDGTTSITSSSFSDCSANAGGAYFSLRSTASVASSEFTNCTGNAQGGAIVTTYGPATIDSSVFSNCSASNGGAINSNTNGILAVSSSVFSNCTADLGGAIMNYGTTDVGNNSVFTGCSAGSGGSINHAGSSFALSSSTIANSSSSGNGGAITVSNGTFNVTSTSFSGCAAGYNGGAVYSQEGSVHITSSSFSDCTAPSGNALSASEYSTMSVHYSRIYPQTGSVWVEGFADATNNWWGSNDDPSGLASGGVTTSPWLVFNITAAPSSINPAGTSLIRANLTRNSAGTDTTSGGIFIPDNTLVSFGVTSGTGSIDVPYGTITSGTNTTTFTPAGEGTNTVSAYYDDTIVSTDVTVTGTTTESRIGVVRSNTTWLLDKSGDGKFGAGDLTYTFGKAGDVPVTGDWDGNGITGIGVVRNNSIWVLDVSGDGMFGAGDVSYSFGKAGDIPVTGDWDGDLATEIGVVRSGRTWYLDASGDGKYGAGDFTYTFGRAGDVPVTGDWDGDLTTEIGVVRSNTTWILDASGNGKFGAGDFTYSFGKAGDKPVIGDWDADVTSEIGVVRGNTTWLLDASGDGKYGAGDLTYSFGKAGDKPVTGKWT
jgi:PKD repeat protein